LSYADLTGFPKPVRSCILWLAAINRRVWDSQGLHSGEKMRCPRCNHENRERAQFCLNCGAGLVFACPECRTELPLSARFCDTCGTATGAPPPVAPAGVPDAMAQRIQRLVPKEYAERLLATRGQVGKERRIVTILFSDIKGSTAMAEELDPEDWAEIMEGAFEVLIEPIYRYEGTLARLMGDAILAFFGAPIAHEDDPGRACRAALEIIEGARRYEERLEKERGIRTFGVRVGINTGLVVVGEVGSDLRVEYTAMGDAINLAARMERRAPPGGILITHDTYSHVRGVFDVLPQEPLRVKGKKQPVQNYLLQRAKPRAFRKGTRGVEGIETRMIGRQAELKRLQEAFYTATEDRELQLVTITGEAGVGKSRLLHEFDIWAEALAERYFFFKGRALQEMQRLPYSLIRDLFAFRFQIEDTDPLPVVREKLEQGASAALGDGEESRMRAHFIGHLLGFELGPSLYLEGVLDDPRQLHDRALAYLVDYFNALAAQLPVLILLEDLHWADDSSLDALNHLALALVDQPLMIVSAARPALLERRPHWGEGQPSHRTLQLEPLSKRNTRRLLDEILQKVDHVPDTLSEPVVAGAEGNPFFVEEVIKMLVEDGVIVKGEEQWHVEPSRLIDVRVPSTLRGVLQARLDRLPALHRTILQQASVVGGLFWDLAVVRISQSAVEGLEEAEILNTLSALRGAEMVFQRQTSAFSRAQEYVFKHAVLREVTYESLLESLRGIYHGLAADWLLEQGGERAGEYNGLIADHLELAGRTEEATEYLLQAGDRARGLYAHQEAIHAYQRALALLKQQEDFQRAARTWMKLGLTYHTAFDFRKARHAYEEGFALRQRAGELEPAFPPAPAPHPLRQSSPGFVTLDPAMSSDIYSGVVIDHLFSGLVNVSPELDILPGVARSWEVLEGGRRYVFHLRDDVHWSDGTLVTAEDFCFAWKRVLDPATGAPWAPYLYDVKGAAAFHGGQVSDPNHVGVRAVDDFTLAVELDEPAAYFLQLLAFKVTYPIPRHVLEAHGEAWSQMENIVANGPFRLQAWQRGESMTLVRNPKYHGPFTGNLELVHLSFVDDSDPVAILETYETGGLDAVELTYLPPAEVERAHQRHAGEYVSAPMLGTVYVGFDTSRPPFDDVRVRRAFVLATDRERLGDLFVPGFYTPASGGFVPHGMPGHSPGIALPYDPEQARQLLADAGYPGGRGFPGVGLAELAAPAPAMICKYLREYWRESLGVGVAQETEDHGVHTDAAHRERAHLFFWANFPPYADPHVFLGAESVCRETRWQNDAYDELVETARRTMDQEQRMDLCRQADRILVKQAAIMPLAYVGRQLLIKPWVSRYPTCAISRGFWQDVIIEPH
jgi:ABC-type oligopeptide transport system substrate-binding subunit/class 3 adenylate cyclase